VPDVQVGRGRIQAELDAQPVPPFEALAQVISNVDPHGALAQALEKLPAHE